MDNDKTALTLRQISRALAEIRIAEELLLKGKTDPAHARMTNAHHILVFLWDHLNGSGPTEASAEVMEGGEH